MNIMHLQGPNMGVSLDKSPVITCWTLLCTFLFLLPDLKAQPSFRIPLKVSEHAGVKRMEEPVRSGVPFPQNMELSSIDSLRLTDDSGKVVPAHFEILGRWGGGPHDPELSIRWLQLDFKANLEAGGTRVYSLSNEGGGLSMPLVDVHETEAHIQLETGPARFRVSKLKGSLFDAVWLDDNGEGDMDPALILPSGQSGSYVIAGGKEYRANRTAPLEVVVDERLPGRVTLRVEGFHHDLDGNPLLRYVTRLAFFAGSSAVKVHHTFIEGRVRDSGNGSLYDDVAPEDQGQVMTPLEKAGLRVALQAPVTEVEWTVEDGNSEITPLVGDASFALRQRTPRRWEDPLVSEVWLQGQVHASHGAALTAMVSATTDDRGGLAVSTRDFWRKGPQQMAVDGKGIVTVDFPAEPYTIYQAMGLAEEILFDFHGGDDFEDLAASSQGFLKDPLFAVAPGDWYVASGALGELTPYPCAQYPSYDERLEGHLEATLEWIEEGHAYGLLNWLDMPIFRSDDSPDPHDVSFGNSYYDAPGACIREFARRGEYRWLRDLAFPQIRHWYTTDAYDTDEIGHPYGGISGARGFYHRSGFTGEYHYMESLWDYYYLTGDRRSLERGLEAARSYAEDPSWDNDFDIGFAIPGITGRMVWQKLNTLLEAWLASGQEPLYQAMVADAEEWLAVIGTEHGFLREDRQQGNRFITEQHFQAVVIHLPVLWKYHALTQSEAAQRVLINVPRHILQHARESENPSSPAYNEFYNFLEVRLEQDGYATEPAFLFQDSDDYLYDPAVVGLLAALGRASALSGDTSLVEEARRLYRDRIEPNWFPDVWDKPNAQQTLRMAPAMAYLVESATRGQASLEILRAGQGQIRLRLTGEPGETYQVMRSTDLATWMEHTQVEVGSEGEVLITELVSQASRLFYRLQ